MQDRRVEEKHVRTVTNWPGYPAQIVEPLHTYPRTSARWRMEEDRDCVLYVDYFRKGGAKYTATAISQYALAHYNELVENDRAENRAAFLRQADWLVTHGTALPGGGRA